MSVEEDCPVCTASPSAKRTFARAKVAEHVKQRAGHDQNHRRWVDKHTEDGSLAEIRAALDRREDPEEG